MEFLVYFVLFPLLLKFVLCDEFNGPSDLYTVDGRVLPPDSFSQSPLGNWQINTRILANGGEYVGFLKANGSFTISNVPSGSYVVEAVHPDFAFEPVRVEISSKGNFRARKVNHIQTSQVLTTNYPLKMKPYARHRYFQMREQWRITDFLLSPMVLMMILPLLLIMVLPKLMNDPETRKEMEQLNNSIKYEMPEISEIFTNMLSGNEKQKNKAVKGSKKKQ